MQRMIYRITVIAVCLLLALVVTIQANRNHTLVEATSQIGTPVAIDVRPTATTKQIQYDLHTIGWKFYPIEPTSPEAHIVIDAQQAIKTVLQDRSTLPIASITPSLGRVTNGYWHERLVWIILLSGVEQQSSGPPGAARKTSNELYVAIDALTGDHLVSFTWTR